MSVMVCDTNNKICMVHRCSDCPGEEALLELLRKLFEEINNDLLNFNNGNQQTELILLQCLCLYMILCGKENKQFNCAFQNLNLSI